MRSLESKKVGKGIIASIVVLVIILLQFYAYNIVYAEQQDPGVEGLRAGIENYENGKYDDAVFNLEMAVYQIPEEDEDQLWDAYFYLGLSYLLIGDADESTKQFIKVQGLIKNKLPDVHKHSPKIVKLFKETLVLKEQEIEGQRTFIWPDGEKYVGEWKDGKMIGQ